MSTTVKRTGAFILATGIAMLAAWPATAQEKRSGELRKLCAEDVKTFCGSITPGKGAIRDCMAANLDKLTPECRAGVEERKKAREEKAKAEQEKKS